MSSRPSLPPPPDPGDAPAKRTGSSAVGVFAVLFGLCIVPLAVLIAATVDGAPIAWGIARGHDVSLSAVATLTGQLSLQFYAKFALVVGCQVLASLLAYFLDRASTRAQAFGWFGVSVVMASVLYLDLVGYEKFQSYLPFMAAAGGLAILWGASYWSPSWRCQSYKSSRWLGIGSLGCAIGAAHAHTHYFLGYYPTLHGALLGVVAISVHASGAALRPTRPEGSRWPWVLVCAAAIFCAALTGLSTISSPPARLAAHAALYTTLLAPAEAARTDRTARDEGSCGPPPPVLSAEDAATTFRLYSGLSDLPDAFRLEGKNIILVHIESLRLDATNLERAGSPTPHLQAFFDRGAFYFSRARTPATSTLQSLASVMTMRYPFDVPLSLATHANWQGALGVGVPVAAELLRASGYHTFHWTHGAVAGASHGTLSRGFESPNAVGSMGQTLSAGQEAVDQAIVAGALRTIREYRSGNKPFFGWVFLLSPHLPFERHGPSEITPRQRYDGDVRVADTQLGILIDQLAHDGTLDDTVVIVTGDHGEAFGEHGRTNHGNSTNAELARVPLLLWLPGVSGRRVDAGTSTLYVLPWLLQRHARTTASTQAILATSIAPLMRATHGAIAVELYQAGGIPDSVSLSDTTHTAVYQFRSSREHVYNHVDDPGERDALPGGLESSPQISNELAAYLGYRECRRPLATP